ncbi:MAG: hypothetical protein ABH874_06520 [Methanobacteriota archaeon]
MRVIQNEETSEALLERMKDYHNFIRPHTTLNGKTPTEVAGINLGLGEKKWGGLIRQSIRAKNGDKENLAKKLLENKSLNFYL